jgi:hypothetical protein
MHRIRRPASPQEHHSRTVAGDKSMFVSTELLNQPQVCVWCITSVNRLPRKLRPISVFAMQSWQPIACLHWCLQIMATQQLSVQAHRCTHAFLWTWDRGKWPAREMGPQPVPHLIESKFLLYVLNGLLSSTAVLVQPLWLSREIPKPQYPFEKTQGEEQQDNPLPVTLVPLPLRLQRSKSRQGTNACTGMLCSALSCLHAFDYNSLSCGALHVPGGRTPVVRLDRMRPNRQSNESEPTASEECGRKDTTAGAIHCAGAKRSRVSDLACGFQDFIHATLTNMEFQI